MHERWFILALLTFARTSVGFQFQSVAAASPELLAHFHMSFTVLGTLIGLFLFPGVAIAIPGGMLAQRFGDKRVMCLGLGAMAAGGALMSATDSLAVLMAGRVLSGAGGVIVNVVVTKMATDWFAGREIGTAFGLMMPSWPLGIAAALVILPPITSAWSWHLAMLVPAAMAASGLVLVALLYRAPDSVGAQPAGKFTFDLTRREIILVSLAGMVWTFYNVGFIIVPAFGPAYTIAAGYTAAAAGALVSVMTWCVIPAVPLFAWLTERFGRADVTLFVAFALEIVAVSLLATLGPSAAIFVLCGIVFAPPGGLVMVLPGEAVRPERRALAMGVYFSWYHGGMGALPALAGYARDLSGNAETPFWFAAAMVVIAALALAQFRALQKRSD